MFIKIF